MSMVVVVVVVVVGGDNVVVDVGGGCADVGDGVVGGGVVGVRVDDGVAVGGCGVCSVIDMMGIVVDVVYGGGVDWC